MTPKELINGITGKGFNCREIADQCGGLADNYSSVGSGHMEKSGNLRRLKKEFIPALERMYEATRYLEEMEHRNGKKRPWRMMINSITSKGFSYQNQGDIVGCNSTHLRDVASPARDKRRRTIVPRLHIQDRLLQLYRETKEWPAKKIRQGAKRNHKYFTMIDTRGDGWQI